MADPRENDGADAPTRQVARPLALKRYAPPALPQQADGLAALRLPSGKFVTTVSLNSRTCRWPIGEPAELDFHYCGQQPESGSPYCDAHDRKSYQSVRSRRGTQRPLSLVRPR